MNRVSPGPADPRLELRQRLSEALHGVPALNSAASLELFVETLAANLPELPQIRLHTFAQAYLSELVQRCADLRTPLAWHELARALRMVAGGDPACRAAERPLAELEALATEPTLDQIWPLLAISLGGMTVEAVLPLVHFATRGRAVELPAGQTDAWSSFVHLVGLSTWAESLPPWVLFVQALCERLPADAERRLRGYLRERAREWDAIEKLEGVRRLFDEWRPPPRDLGVVTVEIRTGSVETDVFTVCCIRRGPDEDSEPTRTDETTVARQELEGAVEHALADAEERWPDSSDMLIEFLLPLSLLNEPVEWWPRYSGEVVAPIAIYYTVVVRSVERLRNRAWHGRWKRRWTQLSDDHAPREVLWARPGQEDHIQQLEAQLAERESYVGLVLSAPPTPRAAGQQEILVGLRAGVPLILWHRTNCTSEEFVALVQDLTRDNLAALPRRAKALRQRIQQLDVADRERHPGRGLTILWDDAGWRPGVRQASAS